ncbi:hypothetical protein H0X48_04770 [Candidatus Dependentiae bacterium]|nr:hypothetical protein [Candidatus Dependentiae bacterium]
MKRSLIIAFLMISFVQLNVYADSLLYAIDSHNVEQVKTLLEPYEHLSHEYKKKLMKAAKQASHEAKAKISIFRSGPDFVKSLAGMSTAGIGIVGVILGIVVRSSCTGYCDDGLKLLATLFSVGSSAVIGAGTVLVYKGLKLSAAQASLAQAREIETAIFLKPAHHE